MSEALIKEARDAYTQSEGGYLAELVYRLADRLEEVEGEQKRLHLARSEGLGRFARAPLRSVPQSDGTRLVGFVLEPKSAPVEEMIDGVFLLARLREYADLGHFAESTGKFFRGSAQGVTQWLSEPPLEEFLESARAEEREACAKHLEFDADHASEIEGFAPECLEACRMLLRSEAAAIRSRPSHTGEQAG